MPRIRATGASPVRSMEKGYGHHFQPYYDGGKAAVQHNPDAQLEMRAVNAGWDIEPTIKERIFLRLQGIVLSEDSRPSEVIRAAKTLLDGEKLRVEADGNALKREALRRLEGDQEPVTIIEFTPRAERALLEDLKKDNL